MPHTPFGMPDSVAAGLQNAPRYSSPTQAAQNRSNGPVRPQDPQSPPQQIQRTYTLDERDLLMLNSPESIKAKIDQVTADLWDHCVADASGFLCCEQNAVDFITRRDRCYRPAGQMQSFVIEVTLYINENPPAIPLRQEPVSVLTDIARERLKPKQPETTIKPDVVPGGPVRVIDV